MPAPGGDPGWPGDGADLLEAVSDQAVDPEYGGVRQAGRRRWWLVGLVGVLVGGLLGTTVANNVRTAPAVAAEREQLIARIEDLSARQDRLHTQIEELARANRRLTDEELALAPESVRVQSQIDALDVTTAMRPVTGPGVVLIADDAEDGSAKGSRVVDVDVRQAVNGLWQAGAEAIAVNGHRLSVRTAIRGAGDAITVDYRSLTRPYRIEAIGDTQRLLGAFPQTPGGAWWAYLKQNFGIRYDLSSAGTLRLNADPGLGVRNAEVAK